MAHYAIAYGFTDLHAASPLLREVIGAPMYLQPHRALYPADRI